MRVRPDSLLVIMSWIVWLLAGCAPHGPLSLRLEAHGVLQDAVSSPGFADVLAMADSQPLDSAAVHETLALAQKAVAIDPYLFDAHIVTIQILAALGRQEACEQQLLYCLELFPDATGLREEAIYMEFERFRNPERAALLLEEGLKRNPSHPGFHLLHAELLADSGGSRDRIAEKLAVLVRFQNLDPPTWYRIVGLCVFLSEEGRFDDSLSPILALARTRPEVLNEAVAWLFAAGLADSAKGLFTHACEQPEAGFDLKLAAARLLVRLEEQSQAAALVEELDAAAGTEHRKTAVLALKGHVRWLEGQSKEALALFQEALDRDPSNYDALDGIWLVYERTPLLQVDEIKGRLRRAAEHAEDPGVRRFLQEKARALQAPAESVK